MLVNCQSTGYHNSQSESLHPYKSWLSCSKSLDGQTTGIVWLSRGYNALHSPAHRIAKPERAVGQSRTGRLWDDFPRFSWRIVEQTDDCHMLVRNKSELPWDSLVPNIINTDKVSSLSLIYPLSLVVRSLMID